jgi:hypothetical protein
MKIKGAFFALIGLFALSACTNGSVSSKTLQSETESQENITVIQDVVEIELTGDAMTVQGEGAIVDLNSLVITQPGRYEISGTLLMDKSL